MGLEDLFKQAFESETETNPWKELHRIIADMTDAGFTREEAMDIVKSLLAATMLSAGQK